MSRIITPKHFYQVGGTLSADAPSYVPRQADQEFLEHVAAGDFCYVLTPRQMGKSSLMVRTVTQLEKRHLRSVVIDLQGKIERGMAVEAFYAGLLDAFIQELRLPIDLTQWWQGQALLSAVQRFSNFVADEVLPRIRKKLVVFIDEIDSTLNLNFADDFFAAIRAFYNDRARNPAFNRLTFVLLGVASPSDLMKDRARSPFNIGSRIELADFTLKEARKLAKGFPIEEKTTDQILDRVLDWTGGHPYLTQKVCAELAMTKNSPTNAQVVDKLINTLFFSDETWSDSNLANVRDCLVEAKNDSDALLELYRRIRTGEQVFDDERSPVHASLKLSGIVKVIPGGVLRSRNRIYDRVFDLAWVDTVLRSRARKRTSQIVTPAPVVVRVTTQEPQVRVGKKPPARLDLEQAIATLESQQRELGLDFAQQIAELQRRLGEMGKLSQSGFGAIAQGPGAVAAGESGVAIGGNVHGNVYVGPSAREPAEALSIYRRVLMESCRHMSLRGLDVGASDPTGMQPRFDLTQVYVDLLTTTQVPLGRTGKRHWKEIVHRLEDAVKRETRPLSVLQAVIEHPRVVLLGDPGSGKSTFLTHLALCLAAHGLEPQHNWLKRLPGWQPQEADVVPVLLTLRDFAVWLQVGARAEPHQLWTFITNRLATQNLAFVAEPLHDRLEKGQVILLLDGLDEIPTQRQRTFIRDAVAVFARRYPDCRIVVTCRMLSYQDPAWQLGDFRDFTLAPFSEEQINHFIAAWYGELARLGSIKPGAVERVTRHLQVAVRRPDLWRLASNPLLLTAMALVHTHKGQLPEARALLYEETIDILLWRWEQVKVSGEDDMHRLRALLAQANRTDVDLKRALWRLAFEAHRKGGTADDEAVADIGEGQLEKALRELHPDKSRDWAHQVLEVMKLRAGLLVERVPEVYTFPHRTFQEYLAGAYLSAQPDFAQQATCLVAEGAFWREIVLLAVGRLVYLNGDTAKPLALVAELCPARLGDTDVAWRQAWLAGDVLLEMGRNRVHDSALGRELAERVRQRLVELLREGRLSPVERAAAGDSLARLGDPRFRADTWLLPDEPLLGFVEIPAGPFMMGSNPAQDEYAGQNEQPQHEVTLPRYYIARYPVTVAQFRVFVEDSGYQPQAQDSLRGLLNHPVVHITWYEALAYCEWLTERLRMWEGTPEPLATLLRQEGWQVTLPSEAEWEKAARGPAPKLGEGRIYPWSDEFDPDKANTAETGIGGTSAVGCFPKGKSPYGVLDLSGNVWEWTRSLWGKDFDKLEFLYPYDPTDKRRENLAAPNNVYRVLRGGAYWANQRLARCAYRGGDLPAGGDDDVGFRVVVLPKL